MQKKNIPIVENRPNGQTEHQLIPSALTIPHARAMPGSPMDNRKKRILLVDDEVGITRLLKMNLEQTEQYIVRVENSATSALDVGETFHPDLIILDIMMPQLDGGALAQQFKESQLLKDVPVIFLTAAATKEEISSKGGRIGGLPFMAKPIDIPEVIACVERWIGSRDH
jgi:DNA-binding response OmpR family regulator